MKSFTCKWIYVFDKNDIRRYKADQSFELGPNKFLKPHAWYVNCIIYIVRRCWEIVNQFYYQYSDLCHCHFISHRRCHATSLNFTFFSVLTMNKHKQGCYDLVEFWYHLGQFDNTHRPTTNCYLLTFNNVPIFFLFWDVITYVVVWFQTFFN